MANFNRCILAGNITRDIKMSFTPAQMAVAEFGMAVNRKWTSKGGEKKEETCFVDLTAFGKTAEVINQYFSKGKPILVEGRLKFSQWDDKQGNKRSKLSVIVENFEFMDPPQGQQPPQPQPQQQQAPAPPSGDDLSGEDIPF